MRALWALLFCAATPVAAQTAFLEFPLDCELGTTCFIEDYVDSDAREKKARDFSCGLNTRDGHKGTDIALLDFAGIETGVDVLAAAKGRVLRTRDEIADTGKGSAPANNACGNAVLIEHENGYRSLYCHLKLGSVQVAPDAIVNAGQVLGQVGLSGNTTHPHLHFQLYKTDKPVDPFRPEQSGSCDERQPENTLWLDPPEYYATILRFAGFSNAVPSFQDMVSAKALLDISAPDQPLVLYVEAGLSQHGDILEFRAEGPAGEIFDHSVLMKSPKKSVRRAFGRRAPAGGWPEGEYTGHVTLTRKGTIIAHRFAHVRVAK